MQEIKILMDIDHPAVLKMYEFYLSVYGDKVYLVTELLDGGELLDTVISRGSYTERDARAIFKSARAPASAIGRARARQAKQEVASPQQPRSVQVLEGLEYLHSDEKQIVHRDLKVRWLPRRTRPALPL